MSMQLASGVSDEILIKRAADGSETSFEELMERYMRVIFSYIALRASETDAADILQETMLAVWRGIKNFNGESTFKTWLFAITRRKICDFYRERKNFSAEYVIPPDDDEFGDFNDVDSTDDHAETLSERLDIAEALKSLVKSERELIFMIFEAGLSYAQISEATGIPVGTIKSRISAIKAKLKRFLGEDYDKM